MTYTFEQAKQAVAQKHGYANWSAIWQDKGITPDEYYEEVFQLGVNENVKATHETIKEKCVYYKGENILFDLQTFQTLFPEK